MWDFIHRNTAQKTEQHRNTANPNVPLNIPVLRHMSHQTERRNKNALFENKACIFDFYQFEHFKPKKWCLCEGTLDHQRRVAANIA